MLHLRPFRSPAERTRLRVLISLSFTAAVAVWIGPATCRAQVSDSPPLTLLEQELVREINALRADPQYYGSLLEKWKPFFHGRRMVVEHNGRTHDEDTQEGLAAVEEAVEVLSSAHPARTLTLSTGLCRAARDHVRDQGPRGAVGHTGSDGSTPSDRLLRYVGNPSRLGEVIRYDRQTARDMVRDWLVDDGIRGRGHRRNLLNPDYRRIGVACGMHTAYGAMCAVDLAADF